MLSSQTLRHFGLRFNPFPRTPSDQPYDSADLRKAQELVRWAIEEQGACAIIGPPLSGKSTAAWCAIDEVGRQSPLRIVDVLSPDRKHMLYSSIEIALLSTLARDRKIPHNAERRAILTRETLGLATREGRTVLVIEEAQALHPQTLKALKRLREFRWGRHCPLLSMVMIGHSALGEKLDRTQEVGLRVSSLRLQGLSPDEAVGYLQHQFRAAGRPDPMTEECMRLLGTREHWPGVLNSLAEAVMEGAFLAGKRQAGIEDAARALDLKTVRPRSSAKAEDVAALIQQQAAQRSKSAAG